MRVIIDTNVWSLVLRRTRVTTEIERTRTRWRELVETGRIVMLGIIRQEVLSGIAERKQFERLRDILSAYDDETTTTADHVYAAECFNLCRKGGIQGSPIDFFLCALSTRLSAPIFTLDADFSHYARHLPIRLY